MKQITTANLGELFDQTLIKDYLNGTTIRAMTPEFSSLFVQFVLEQNPAIYFISFKKEEDAYKYYLSCLNNNQELFLYYPSLKKDLRVPGFSMESERYREEAIVNLGNADRSFCCIGTVESFSAKSLSAEHATESESLELKIGDDADRDNIGRKLASWGYEKNHTVLDPGSFALRGDILDIYPIYFRDPVRILFDYDKVSLVSVFNPTTQLKTGTLTKLSIKKTRGGDPQAIDNISLIDATSPEYFVSVDVDETGLSHVWLPSLSERTLNIKSIEFGDKNYSKRISFVKKLGKNKTVFLVGRENEKPITRGLFDDATWVNGHIHRGFYSDDTSAVVVSLSQLLNNAALIEKWKPSFKDSVPNNTIDGLGSLVPGDYVVHKTFGVGIYRGMVFRGDGSGGRECVELEYAQNTRVYVSIEKMEFIHRYVGSSKDPIVSSLGSKKWLNEVKKTRLAVQLVAKELIDIYASKNKKRAFRYHKEHDLNGGLRASFPFSETPDQQKAIDDVLSDMDGDSPVDRLVCGDVGFGKTEVALRAIMKAVISNRQSLFLCPTTILADQHFITCQERLGSLGVSVALISRFKTKKEQEKIIHQLKNGDIDVLIGTHRVLSPDIVFIDLGLLVVDEEHRFGVSHKEKIRKLKQQVDVITLSATPIPRTLQQSLVGLRDISLIRTPPKARKPIETTVVYFDWENIFVYIKRELDRKGQVYFLHNNIQSLPYVTKKLKERFPFATVESIHGQMNSKELESKILSFFGGGIDILSCTTIIESGLDVSNANCIIINDAQNFGLAQLYQIRGRVGRSQRQANCLLLVPRKPLEKNAYRRLKTVEQFTSLGSGYDISIKDLEIRGAGSIFGYKQSGHISSVGYEMYCDLLKSEIDQATGEISSNRLPDVIFDGDALINDFYISNPDQRLDFYSRLSRAQNVSLVLSIGEEMNDRFGPHPEETKNLLFIAKIRAALKNTSVSKINISKSQVSFVLDDIKPYKTIEQLFHSVDSFLHPGENNHRFKKTKKGDLELVFFVGATKGPTELALKSSELFSLDKGG